MPHYFFDIEGSTQHDDRTGRYVRDPLDLRAQALAEAAKTAAHESQRGRETIVTVTVRDSAGEICLKVRLLSQVDVP